MMLYDALTAFRRSTVPDRKQLAQHNQVPGKQCISHDPDSQCRQQVKAAAVLASGFLDSESHGLQQVYFDWIRDAMLSDAVSVR